MSTFYLDTSALIKRYLTETGSLWIASLRDLAVGNVIIVCDLTAVEVFSALARRQREGALTPANVLILQSRFLADMEREYLSIALESVVMTRARDLVTRYPLRSLDALQLASAVEAFHVLGEPLIFVSADNNLLTAAADHGLNTDNPRDHS